MNEPTIPVSQIRELLEKYGTSTSDKVQESYRALVDGLALLAPLTPAQVPAGEAWVITNLFDDERYVATKNYNNVFGEWTVQLPDSAEPVYVKNNDVELVRPVSPDVP